MAAVEAAAAAATSISKFRLREAPSERELRMAGHAVRVFCQDIKKVEQALLTEGSAILHHRGNMSKKEFQQLLEGQRTLEARSRTLLQRLDDIEMLLRQTLPTLLANNDAMRASGLRTAGAVANGSPVSMLVSDLVPLGSQPMLSTARLHWPAEQKP